jgi:hypothetical protein
MGTFLIYAFYYCLAVTVLYALVGEKNSKVEITTNIDAVVNSEDIENFEEEMEKSREIERLVKRIET